MLTEYGKLIREIRHSRGENLGSMAAKLGVSVAFLSAVEVGKKQVPIDYADKISELYGLSAEENQKMNIAISKSNESVYINISNYNDESKEMSVLFARKINKVSQKTLEELRKILTEDKQEDK